MLHQDAPSRRAAPVPARRSSLPRARLGLALLLAAFAACGQDPDPGPRGAGARHDHAHDDDHAHGEHEKQDEHEDEVTLTAEAVARYGVETDAARRSILRPTLRAPARVSFNTESMAHVGSPLRGRAAEVRVRVGDRVQVGQPLAIIESPELGEAQAGYLQRRVAVQTAGPAVELTKVAWERAKGLYEQSQGVSLTEVQRREAEYKAAVAAQKAAESAERAAANHLHLLGMTSEEIAHIAETGELVPRHTIRAAIDGVVVQRELTLGELVSPEREALMVLADATDLWVLADVPESRLVEVHPGATAWVDIGSPAASTRDRFTGTVAFISPLVDPTTRTAQVRIAVPLTETGLRPGMFAQVEIAIPMPDGTEPEPVVAVPEEAIQTIAGAPVVFVPVAGEPGTYRKRAVAVGRTVSGLVPVHSGLAEGETFVAAGTFILKAELGKGAAAHDH